MKRLDSDLANDLGNLVNRTCSMIERYGEGRIPPAAPVGCAVDDEPLREAALGLAATVERAMERMEFSAALEAVMRLVTQANQYVEAVAPWKLAKERETARLHGVLHVLAEVLRIAAIALEPFMPSVTEAIWRQLGCRGERRLADAARWGMLAPGQTLGPHPVLFPRGASR